jgi:hypothetical protein
MDSKVCMFIEIYIHIYRLIAFKHYCFGQIKRHNTGDIAIGNMACGLNEVFSSIFISHVCA